LAVVCAHCNSDRTYMGLLKSLGLDYGFIDCAETIALYQRDVYISRHVLVNAFRRKAPTSGVSVSFQVFLNDDGHPNAKSLKILNVKDLTAAEQFFGHVKYLSDDKGFGFVECTKAFDLYHSDVHVSLEELDGCCLGQDVTFSVRLGQVGGRPQAYNVVAAGPVPSVMPTSITGMACKALRPCWQERVLLFGEGDLSFASSVASIHSGCHLDATVFLNDDQWAERFPEDQHRILALRERGHEVRFNVDATTESCASCAAVFFNFPHVSASESYTETGATLSLSGQLASAFLVNACKTADTNTLIVLGLWGRCDGRYDSTLYGHDTHSLVAAAVETSWEQGSTHVLEDALQGGFARDGVFADYGFYDVYSKQAGYYFRTNCTAVFETSHRDWHLQGCFILRVIPRVIGLFHPS